MLNTFLYLAFFFRQAILRSRSVVRVSPRTLNGHFSYLSYYSSVFLFLLFLCSYCSSVPIVSQLSPCSDCSYYSDYSSTVVTVPLCSYSIPTVSLFRLFLCSYYPDSVVPIVLTVVTVPLSFRPCSTVLLFPLLFTFLPIFHSHCSSCHFQSSMGPLTDIVNS